MSTKRLLSGNQTEGVERVDSHDHGFRLKAKVMVDHLAFSGEHGYGGAKVSIEPEAI